MSYPDPTYFGDTGEASATYRSALTPHDFVYPSGTTVDFLAGQADTDGLFGLYRWNMSAVPGGPGPHFHRSFKESFFILDGTVRIYDGRAWIDAQPGDWIHIPEGGIHGFRNESGPASMLIHFAPGAPREEYFFHSYELADMPEAERAAFYMKHDNHVL